MAQQDRSRYGWDHDQEVLKDPSQQSINSPAGPAPSASTLHRLRSDESWVEISSQPSSSSLSSAATDDIVTTGLRVQQNRLARRRRRLHLRSSAHPCLRPAPPGSRSSQEEYEESESEEDAVVSSSNEHILADRLAEQEHRSVHVFADLPGVTDGAGAEENDDDENATALGVSQLQDVFTPQPNAFSHPPSARASRSSGPQPGRASEPLPLSGRRDIQSFQRPSHNPFNVIAPSYQADNDAALRASLSTLLSCAAAARGLSKRDPRTNRLGGRPGLAPETLRIVPESVVLGVEPVVEPPQPEPSEQRAPSDVSSRGRRSQQKPKRKMSSIIGKGERERVAKKARRAMEEPIAPTLLTWVVSAGVVVLVSAISFSAGYSMGKEVGRSEANFLDVAEGRRCGREAVKGLGRFRWSTAGNGTVSV